MRRMSPLCAALAAALALTSCGGGSQRKPASPPASVRTDLGAGIPLAWTSGGLLVARPTGKKARGTTCTTWMPEEYDLTVVDPTGAVADRPLGVPPLMLRPSHAAASPDGRYVAILGECDTEGSALTVVATAGGAPRSLPLTKRYETWDSGGAGTLEWTPAGRLVVLYADGEHDTQERLLDPATLTSKVVRTDDDLEGVRVRADGPEILLSASNPFGGDDDGYQELVAATPPRKVGVFEQLLVAPDGVHAVAWKQYESDVFVGVAPVPRAKVSLGDDGVQNAWWSSRSDRVLVTWYDLAAEQQRFVILDAQGHRADTSLPGYGTGQVVWSPDGTHVAYATGDLDSPNTVKVAAL